MDYVIIGNGVAGIEAAIAIRKFDDEGSIRLISCSPYPFYYRPRLSEYLKGGVSLASFTVYKPDFYSERKITNILGTTVTALHPDSRTIILENGSSLDYDRLLLATGSKSFLPSIPGINDPCVHSLRTVADADRILECTTDAGRVLVVGGGLLGLEMAYYLSSNARKVTIIEHSGRLLPRQLDEQGAVVLRRILEEKIGLEFVLSETISTIETSREVHEVICESGTRLKTDLVLVATGIRCRTELAREAGIAVNRGIIVDDFLTTSYPHIFSAGDACEHNGRTYGIWPVARTQGQIAGSNMSGVCQEYRGSVPSTTLKIPGVNLFSAGDFLATDGEILVSSGEYEYRKLVMRDGKPVGGIVLGDPAAMVAAMRVFDGRAPVDVLLKFFE